MSSIFYLYLEEYFDIWSFFNNLPFVKCAKSHYENPQKLIDEIKALSFTHEKHQKLNFLLSILLDLSIDPYFWTVHLEPDFNITSVMKKWTEKFKDSEGIECLIELLTSVDCFKIDNILHFKTLVALFRSFNIYYPG